MLQDLWNNNRMVAMLLAILVVVVPFQTDNRQVMKVGVEFSAETRNVSRWLIEE